MNFLLLAIQSTVCVSCVYTVKRLKVISFRDFDMQDAKNWFPISFLLVSVIYTGSKAIVSYTFTCSVTYVKLILLSSAISQYTSVHDI